MAMYTFKIRENKQHSPIRIDFFRQSLTKIMGKYAIWRIFHPFPLSPLNNVVERWKKLRSALFMASQHCIGGERGYSILIFSVPIIFCHWLSENWKKINERSPAIPYLKYLIPALLSLTVSRYTLKWTKWQKMAP